MAYTIIRSNGSTLTTIQDGTINTTNTSLGLPGRNYAGYGQTLNTNFVRVVENFANDTPPPNPIKGQLWFNTTNNTLNLCPGDGPTYASAGAWLTLASTSTGGGTTLGSLNVTGNLLTNNITTTNAIIGDTITVRMATVSDTLQACVATITSGTIPSLNTQTITTGGNTTSGTIQGQWTVQGNNVSGGDAFYITSGNIHFASNSYGIRCGTYMNLDGTPFTPTGTYNSANVFDYLTGANSVTRFTGNIAPTQVTTSRLAGGGTVQGVWTLEQGARFQATYADLAERFEADQPYEPGTVVEIGGTKEITAVVAELSETVFGVVSNTAAMLMNGAAGDDATHPPVAVSGRVQVKVIGRVKKGDRLVSAGNGTARTALTEELTAFNTIGRALGNKDTDELGTVEAIVIIR
jgi:Peptidase_G2, IMC autoproteolytic cleavage domain